MGPTVSTPARGHEVARSRGHEAERVAPRRPTPELVSHSDPSCLFLTQVRVGGAGLGRSHRLAHHAARDTRMRGRRMELARSCRTGDWKGLWPSDGHGTSVVGR